MSPRISTTTIVMSSAMTILSFFLRDSTNILSFLPWRQALQKGTLHGRTYRTAFVPAYVAISAKSRKLEIVRRFLAISVRILRDGQSNPFFSVEPSRVGGMKAIWVIAVTYFLIVAYENSANSDMDRQQSPLPGEVGDSPLSPRMIRGTTSCPAHFLEFLVFQGLVDRLYRGTRLYPPNWDVTAVPGIWIGVTYVFYWQPSIIQSG